MHSSQKTPLYEKHLEMRATLVDFTGWSLPLHYGSQIEEHHYVRHDAGMFDVSHMTVVDLHQKDAQSFLRRVLANDVARLVHPGDALYTCMLNARGGVQDDLIVYWRGDSNYRLILNASTRDKDLAHLRAEAVPFQVVIEERQDLAMIAIQGPHARAKTLSVFPHSLQESAKELARFKSGEWQDFFVARTGYTGEDGFEILLPRKEAPFFWDKLKAVGVFPCGLGARDTLRLEAGMNLYGNDMDESVTPLVSNLEWTVAFVPLARDFIGRKALMQQKEQGVSQKMVGVVLKTPGVLRSHQTILMDGKEAGMTTSGTFSPTLKRGIALARVSTEVGATCQVVMRNTQADALVITPPFVRNGKQTF
ncbi:MAG: glycine cleavage system aminomethyltransferase GcvT [Gammaproteobacteria bacterium]|nr:glycine cleavage system aminomethyltransferase GcvT [Gammaproteobacteria bacterium]